MSVLLGPQTSRANKLALVAEYQSRGAFVRYTWAGVPMRSRLLFWFDPLGLLCAAKSYEEDVAPLLKDRTA